MAKRRVEESSLISIADAIRSKSGTTGELEFPNGFKAAIEAIETDNGVTPTGTIEITENGTYDVTEHATANVNVPTQSSDGGIVPSGTIVFNGNTDEPEDVSNFKYASVEIPEQGAATIRPGTSEKTAVSAGKYTTGDVKVEGDSRLIPENIKSGVSIFGVAGSYVGSGESGGSGDNVVGPDIEVDSLSELHSWDKYSIGETLGKTDETNVFLGTAQHNSGISVEYANGVDTSSGQLALSTDGYGTVKVTSDSSGSVLKGKVVRTSAGLYYEIPTTATVDHQNGTLYDNLYVSEAKRLTYTPADGTLIGIVVSEDSNAYPQNGEQDGYKYVYNGTLDSGSCDHTAVTQATPSITVSESGLITASSTQSAGLVSAGTKTATQQITHTNLTASNIKKGVNIFNVTGTYEGSGGVTLPTLTSPGTAANLESGKQLIDASGNVVTGTLATKDSVMVASGGTISEYDTDEFKISGTISSSGLPAILKSGATATIYTYRSAYGDATEDDVRAGKTFTSAAGVKKTGKAVIGSGSGSEVVIKSGKTSNATFDTGLSSVAALMISRATAVNSVGLVSATYHADSDSKSYVYCSSYGSMVSRYTSSPTASYIYLTFDGGTVSWTGTTSAAFASGAEYNWVAIGYE